MRLFVALLLSEAWLDALRQVQARLRELDAPRSVRWVDPANIHLTLRFIGEFDPERLEALRAALDAAVCAHAAPHLAPAGLGAFPNPARARVLWVGIQESGERLGMLQSAVEDAVQGVGLPAERRGFRPHLTLGRVRDPRRGLPSELVRALSTEAVPGWTPAPETRVALMRSHLSPRGAHYESLHTWELSA